MGSIAIAYLGRLLQVELCIAEVVAASEVICPAEKIPNIDRVLILKDEAIEDRRRLVIQLQFKEQLDGG